MTDQGIWAPARLAAFLAPCSTASWIHSCKPPSTKPKKPGDRRDSDWVGLVYEGRLSGGHNQRVQKGSVIHHAEMNCLENAGRLKAAIYRQCTIYSTLSRAQCAAEPFCSRHSAGDCRRKHDIQRTRRVIARQRGKSRGVAKSRVHPPHARIHKPKPGSLGEDIRGVRQRGSTKCRQSADKVARSALRHLVAHLIAHFVDPCLPCPLYQIYYLV